METMETTGPKEIFLPPLYKEGDMLEDGSVLDVDKAEELNYELYDYLRRTAKTFLNRLIIDPFEEALKNEAYEADNFPYRKTLGDKKFVVDVKSSSVHSYKDILSGFENFLEDVITDNKKSRAREGVRKVDDEPYISIKYLIGVAERYYDKKKTSSDGLKLELRNAETDIQLEPDKKIKEMRVFDIRYADITEETADAYYKAISLDKEIDVFLKGYRKGEKDSRIEKEELEESIWFFDDFSDGCALSELFSPVHRLKYKRIYDALMEDPEKNIAAGTGDLKILEKQAFESLYVSSTKEGGIKVETQPVGRSKRKGKTKIWTWDKDRSQVSEPTSEYSVFKFDGRKYVRVQDILYTLNMLKEKHVTYFVHPAIEVLPPPPPGVSLRNAAHT